MRIGRAMIRQCDDQRSDDRVRDDRELLAAWSRGDRAAGAELFDRHYPSIARFFHNKVGEAAQDDLIQETFLACLASAARFRGQAQVRTFLFGIAHNVLALHLRRARGRLGGQGAPDRDDDAADVGEEPAISLGLSPVVAAAQREEQRLLLEALRRIPLIHQVAIELHYWEDLSAAEIAEAVGVPLGTAKTRLRDGRAYLEAQLRALARSQEFLRSTLDNLEQWARRVRDHLVPGAPGA